MPKRIKDDIVSKKRRLNIAIKDMQNARDIHQKWVEYIEVNGNVANVGDITWHRNWVKKYDRTLYFLNYLKQLKQ